MSTRKCLKRIRWLITAPLRFINALAKLAKAIIIIIVCALLVLAITYMFCSPVRRYVNRFILERANVISYEEPISH